MPWSFFSSTQHADGENLLGGHAAASSSQLEPIFFQVSKVFSDRVGSLEDVLVKRMG